MRSAGSARPPPRSPGGRRRRRGRGRRGAVGSSAAAADGSSGAAARRKGRVQPRPAEEEEEEDEADALPEEDGPRLSYACVCAAVAAELQLPVAEVRELGMSSVDEWRANFPPEDWQRVRARALALENAKRAHAAEVQKAKSQKSLDKIAGKECLRSQERNRDKTDPRELRLGRGPAAAAAQVRLPADPRRGQQKPGRGGGGVPEGAAAGAARRSPAAEGRGSSSVTARKAGIKDLATANRFGGFESSDSGGDDA